MLVACVRLSEVDLGLIRLDFLLRQFEEKFFKSKWTRSPEKNYNTF